MKLQLTDPDVLSLAIVKLADVRTRSITLLLFRSLFYVTEKLNVTHVCVIRQT